MKSIYYKIIILVLAVTAVGCSDDDLLNKDPHNSVSENVAFDSPENIELTMNGLYEGFAMGEYSSSSRGYIWGSAFVQQNEARGEDLVSTVTFYKKTYTSVYDPTTANNRYYWEDGYKAINKANIVIEGVQKAQEKDIITEEQALDYIGQARFLRGITHFEMLIQFARPYSDNPDADGIPLRLTAVNTEESMDEALEDGGKKTISEVYDSVLEDLDFAEENINENIVTRAGSDAAVAFKTRVYLHMREWNKVIEEGAKIEGKYSFEPEPFIPYADNRGNTEYIFGFDLGANSNPGTNGALPATLNRRELMAISPIIWNKSEWLVDDKRRTMVDLDEGEEVEDEHMVKKSDGVLYTLKYRDTKTNSDLPPVLRYADVKLNVAEAQTRLSNAVEAEAVENLNEVRNRSLADPSTQAYSTADFASGEELVKAILMERRIEFLAEGRRWGDIHRLQNDDIAPADGIPAKLNNGYPAADAYDAASDNENYNLGISPISYDDYRFIWPVPSSELITNPNIEPTPGY